MALRSLVSLGIVLILMAPVHGQGERPLSRLFGTRPADKAPAKPAPIDPRRLAEIQVEIAWLADPLTFPYFLEARAASGALEVRGYVPNRSVHDQALKVAKVYSSLPVVDAVKEHPSLQVKAGQMSPQQLYQAVTSALREALPRGAGQLQVQCAPSGQVAVSGTVASHEERLTVSHALRRLYGCTSVQNLTNVAGEAPQRPTNPSTDVAKKPAPPVQAASNAPRTNPTAKPVAPVQRPEPAPKVTDATPASRSNSSPRPEVQPTPAPSRPETTKVAEPTKAAEPMAEGPVVKAEKTETKEVKAAPPPAASPALAARVQKAIEEACKGVKTVRVEAASASEFRIEITTATEEQVGTFASAILMLPDLQEYKADLHFKVMP